MPTRGPAMPTRTAALGLPCCLLRVSYDTRIPSFLPQRVLGADAGAVGCFPSLSLARG